MDPTDREDKDENLFGTYDGKLEDVRKLLNSSQPRDKQEGMKRCIAMYSKGRDVSILFPDVVKNVVCPSLQVKKLVHIYLVHYAEAQQDLALLSVGTFQKNLKDSNQLIRSMSLKVLSSIRVPIIAEVVMAAVKACCSDSSPYVRKTAAHAISKVRTMGGPLMQNELKEMVGTLLGDSSTLVLGSAASAYMEICPDAYELIHPHYRKLCNLIVDMDEWGQVYIIRMLARYCRAHFLDPNSGKEFGDEIDRPFYSDDEAPAEGTYYMNEDHRLLLRSVQPLLQSRNSAVVVAVAMVFYHCAPKAEAQQVGKALVRLVRSSREKQFCVLANIATMAAVRPSMFINNLNEFFVVSGDRSYIRSLKLEILTHLASEANISNILRELKTYVKSGDIPFVTESIQAVGKCAMRVRTVTDSCLDGLMSLLSSRTEAVVAESVVVVKKLLQLQGGENESVIRHLAALLDSITNAQARASIVWVVGEYNAAVPLIAPDVLRKVAKNFIHEDDGTKLQILNLGAKLFLTNPTQTTKLFEYVLRQAKYDLNYDIRDRARFIRMSVAANSALSSEGYTARMYLAKKPEPAVESRGDDRSRYTIGSLSHALNSPVEGYDPLPEWPATEPNVPERNVVVFTATGQSLKPSSSSTNKDDYNSFLNEDDDYYYYSDDDAAGGGGGKKNKDPLAAFYGEEEDEYYYSESEEEFFNTSKGKAAPAAKKPAVGANRSGGGGGGGKAPVSATAKAPAAATTASANNDDDYYYYSDDDGPVVKAAPTSTDPFNFGQPVKASAPSGKTASQDLMSLF